MSPTAALIASFVTLQFATSIALEVATNATAEYVLDSSIDQCTDAGQKEINHMLVSLLQKPTNMPTGMKWPKDSLEDEGTPGYEMLKKFPEKDRWKIIGLLKALHPVYFVETLAKEVRDNLLCNLKRMECMSIDDISTPIESIKGTRLIYAMIDALPEEQKPVYHNMVAEVRKRFIEPTMLLKYRYTVKPQKDFVESLVPKGYPYDPIPSMPSSVEGDFDISKGGYPYVGTASLPTPNGPAYRSIKQSQFSLLQMAEKSRQRCNDMTTEIKKSMCHLDLAAVQSKIMRRMGKRSEMPEFSKSEGDTALAALDQIETAMAEMKKNHQEACKKVKDI